MQLLSNHTKTLIDETIVIDMTAAILPVDIFNPRAKDDNFETFVQEYIDAGITWISLSVSFDPIVSIEATIKALSATRNYLLAHPDRYLLINTVDDVYQAKQQGRLGINFNFQGTNPLAGDLNLIETYRRLGVGHMLMAYNQMNLVGDGCHEKSDAGLTRYGQRLIQEMNHVGMIVDATHTGYQTTLDMCEISTAPVIFSHSNVHALLDHERNIKDEQIKACAKTQGVIGVMGCGLFLTEGTQDISASALLRHIDYIANLVGPEYVGLGLDYVGTFSEEQNQTDLEFYRAHPEIYPPEQRYGEAPLRFARPNVIPELAEALLNNGYSENHVLGILGENLLRVCRDVWK